MHYNSSSTQPGAFKPAGAVSWTFSVVTSFSSVYAPGIPSFSLLPDELVPLELPASCASRSGSLLPTLGFFRSLDANCHARGGSAGSSRLSVTLIRIMLNSEPIRRFALFLLLENIWGNLCTKKILRDGKQAQNTAAHVSRRLLPKQCQLTATKGYRYPTYHQLVFLT